jgi:hypothetical protein
MSFNVTLTLPNLCDPGDWQDSEPTPVDAVDAFVAAASGSPDLWAYVVTDESTGQTYVVDMADGPSIIEHKPS